MHRWTSLFAVVTFAVPVAVAAAPSPVVIARCQDSKIEVVPAGAGTLPATGAPAELHALIVTPGERWSFVANIAQVRIGAATRTIGVEDIRTQDRKPARGDKDAAPAGLFIDVHVADKKLILRHPSEGAPDSEYAVDLDKCSFGPGGDAALAALGAPPTEALGCAPATVRGAYRTQVGQAAKLSEADADREALALCEDHQKTIDARNRLEAAISDRAAHDRIAARGAALLRVEDARIKTWIRVDGCLGPDTGRPSNVAALHAAESKTRACYQQIAARP